MSKNVLPAGNHHDLHIDHAFTGRGGTVLTPGPWRTLIHDTEGMDFEAMSRVLTTNRDEPHFLLGKVEDAYHVRQFLTMNKGARALEHPGGTLPTNNTHTVQIEVCEFQCVHGGHDWPEDTYDALAKLCLMIEARKPVPRVRHRAFSTIPHRFGQLEFIRTGGIMGHQHAPSQTKGHTDPGALRALHLIDRMDHFAPMIHGR